MSLRMAKAPTRRTWDSIRMRRGCELRKSVRAATADLWEARFDMRRITAIVRPEKLERLKEALFEAHVSGMTITQVMGCGNQHGWSEFFRGTEVLLNMIPKVKFELVVPDSEVDRLVELICDTAATGEVGDGKIFISPVEEIVRIRTRERGEAAV